jgi:choline-sulfatase
MAGITRKQFLAWSAAPLVPRFSFAQASPRKNILLLMSDQHRPRALGVDGDPLARTPNLDALARTSTRFASAYCSNPVCVPSRASLLTGLYTHNHGALNNGTSWASDKKTIAHYLGRAGYMSALIGKMHFVDAQTHGFDYHLGFNDWFQYLGPKTKLYADELSRANSGSGLPEIDDLWRDSGDPWKGERAPDGRQGPVHPGGVSKLAEQDHFESFVARESVRFLRTHGRRQPFFLISSFLKPHDPFMPASRFAAMFRARDMKLPDTWGKVDLATIPREIANSIRASGPTPELLQAENARQRIASYYANLAQMDDALGKVVDALRELDLEKDTLVLYTSDHGEMLGEHGLWNKFVFYEPSVGVPLIVRVPGLTQPDARSQTPVSLVQVLPTLLDLCGIPIPSGLDGESLSQDLREPARRRDTTVYAEYNLGNPRAKYMIRRGDFKYNYYTSDTPELYDLRSDPQEMRNLARQAEYQRKLEELKAQLFAWHRPAEAQAG